MIWNKIVCNPQSPKYLLFGLLQKSLLTSDLEYNDLDASVW